MDELLHDLASLCNVYRDKQIARVIEVYSIVIVVVNCKRAILCNREYFGVEPAERFRVKEKMYKGILYHIDDEVPYL